MNDTDNQQERSCDAAWLAGLWEGEGSFSIYGGKGYNRFYPMAQLVNSDFELIEEIHAILERYNIGHYIQLRPLSQKNSKHKDIKIVYVVGMKRVKELLAFLLPFLRGKKKEVAKVVNDFVE